MTQIPQTRGRTTLTLLTALLLSQLFLPSGACQVPESAFTIPTPPARVSPSSELMIAALRAAPLRPPAHRFSDRTNVALIAAGFGLRAADVMTTRELLRRGGQEKILPERLVRSTPAFAAYSAGTAAGNALLMYWAHRTGHHKIERALGWTHAAFLAGLVVNNSRWLSSHPQIAQIPQR